MLAAAEPLEGQAIAWARQVAAELAVELVAGSFLERLPDSDRVANTCVHVDREGIVRACYRKIHMFDVEVEGRAYRESEIEEPGGEIVVSEAADDVRLGLSICYDVRFPELYRILALRGALVFPLPAAFTLATTRDHWEVLLRARAIENQAFVVAANQVGSHPGGHRSGGRSMVVDPWGVVLAQAQDAPGYIVAELDMERQRRIRRELPALANRRPGAYSWPQREPVELDGAPAPGDAAAVRS
jgi:predicted amidohydrolase